MAAAWSDHRLDAECLLRQCDGARCAPGGGHSAISRGFPRGAGPRPAGANSLFQACHLRPGRPAQPLPHFSQPLHHLRKRLRIWLYTSQGLVLALPLISHGAVLLEPRPVCLDASSTSLRRGSLPLLAEPAARWRRLACRGACLLLPDCLLSGLGGNFFLRQPFLYFPDHTFHFGPGHRAGPLRQSLSQTPCRNGLRGLRAGLFRPLEPGFSLSMGRALDSRSRADLLERNDSQSVFCRAAADFGGSPALSLPARGHDAADRTARLRAV